VLWEIENSASGRLCHLGALRQRRQRGECSRDHGEERIKGNTEKESAANSSADETTI